MYSRSYYPDSQGTHAPPENYDGTMFMSRDEDRTIEEEMPADESHTSEKTAEASASARSLPILSGLLGDGGLLGRFGLGSFKLGTEEILILATAAFLFFSKGGDKECALILLLLLFIN